jgi:hypothetical protein
MSSPAPLLPQQEQAQHESRDARDLRRDGTFAVLPLRQRPPAQHESTETRDSRWADPSAASLVLQRPLAQHESKETRDLRETVQMSALLPLIQQLPAQESTERQVGRAAEALPVGAIATAGGKGGLALEATAQVEQRRRQDWSPRASRALQTQPNAESVACWRERATCARHMLPWVGLSKYLRSSACAVRSCVLVRGS